MKLKLFTWAMIALALMGECQAQNRRLTLDPNNAIMSIDTTSNRLYLTNGANDTAPLSVSLVGLPGGAVYDAFVPPGGPLCLVPQPAPPVPTYVLLTGTPIGGMTANGGVASAFDGITAKPYLASAHSPTAVSGYQLPGTVGLQLSSPSIVVRIVVYSPTDQAFQGNGSTTNWALFAANSNNFSGATQIASGVLPSGAVGAGFQPASTDVAFANTTAYSFYWLAVQGNGTNGVYAAQAQLYTQSTPASGRNIVNNNGVYANSIAEACQADTGPIPLAVYGAQYYGSVQIDDTGGTTTCQFSKGLDRLCGVWNVSRDAEICLIAIDPRPPIPGPFCHPGTSCVVYIPSTYGNTQRPYQFGPTESNPLWRIRVLQGLPIDSLTARLHQATFSNGITAFWSGIAVNGNPVPCDNWINSNTDAPASPVVQQGHGESAECELPPQWGVITFAAIEGQRAGENAFWGADALSMRACFRY